MGHRFVLWVTVSRRWGLQWAYVSQRADLYTLLDMNFLRICLLGTSVNRGKREGEGMDGALCAGPCSGIPSVGYLDALVINSSVPSNFATVGQHQ